MWALRVQVTLKKTHEHSEVVLSTNHVFFRVSVGALAGGPHTLKSTIPWSKLDARYT